MKTKLEINLLRWPGLEENPFRAYAYASPFRLGHECAWSGVECSNFWLWKLAGFKEVEYVLIWNAFFSPHPRLVLKRHIDSDRCCRPCVLLCARFFFGSSLDGFDDRGNPASDTHLWPIIIYALFRTLPAGHGHLPSRSFGSSSVNFFILWWSAFCCNLSFVLLNL